MPSVLNACTCYWTESDKTIKFTELYVSDNISQLAWAGQSEVYPAFAIVQWANYSHATLLHEGSCPAVKCLLHPRPTFLCARDITSGSSDTHGPHTLNYNSFGYSGWLVIVFRRSSRSPPILSIASPWRVPVASHRSFFHLSSSTRISWSLVHSF